MGRGFTKTGFKEHFAASVFFAAMFLLAFGAYSDKTLVLASIVFIFSSLIPDIDHPKSIPRRIARALFFILSLSSILFFLLLYFGAEPIVTFILAPAAGLLAASLLTGLFDFLLPKHRQEFHSIWAGGFFGLAVLAISAILLPFQDAVVFGLASGSGYAFHIMVDFFGDRI